MDDLYDLRRRLDDVEHELRARQDDFAFELREDVRQLRRDVSYLDQRLSEFLRSPELAGADS